MVGVQINRHFTDNTETEKGPYGQRRISYPSLPWKSNSIYTLWLEHSLTSMSSPFLFCWEFAPLFTTHRDDLEKVKYHGSYRCCRSHPHLGFCGPPFFLAQRQRFSHSQKWLSSSFYFIPRGRDQREYESPKLRPCIYGYIQKLFRKELHISINNKKRFKKPKKVKNSPLDRLAPSISHRKETDQIHWHIHNLMSSLEGNEGGRWNPAWRELITKGTILRSRYCPQLLL